MSTEEQETAPVAAEELPAKTEKKSANKKGKSGAADGASPAKKKKPGKNQRGRYSQLVVEIIESLASRNGSSLAKIANEAKKVPWFDPQNGRTYLKASMKALLNNGTLTQVKGIGVNGSFKINKKKLEGQKGKKKAASPSKATKPAAKKLVKKTTKPKAKTSAKKEKKSAKVTAGAKKKVVAKSKKTKKATTAGAKKEKKGTKGKTQKKSKSKKA
ncbi:histone H1.10-like [Latimeria chalumnae]|uniref:histone H1.10-like n=1 Tax=Latimeria chalumnae TaxID=7897 RepID=UPI00313D43A7